MSNTAAWIRNVVSSLENEVDQATCRRILEACGRKCFPLSLGKKSRSIWESAKTGREFVERLHKACDRVTIEDGLVYIICPECYCRRIRGVPVSEMPNAYCHCSAGWAKELFLQATGRDVDVVAVSTIVRSGTECRFRVDLGVALDTPLR
jgi:hypothetical protein